ncbi:MAG: hypothetical protein A3F09_00985 [Chlamydiae bacterium RIFCSPHIGHO2_12_FULL_49_11]|nr:MAG: hypothetical protein A3F09_00985 [Chlamydiae bacterium RIFCSPHIGHO2_12_FULL_49_11]
MASVFAAQEESKVTLGHNLSHEKRDLSFEETFERISKKIKERGELSYVSVEKQLEYLNLLSEFGLGKFLIERGGVNGYWTDYIMSYPDTEHSDRLNAMENFLLNRAPLILATQERYKIFKSEMQKRVRDGASFMSIPCGLMADCLQLDFSQVTDFSLTGIDLDQESLDRAADNSKKYGLESHSSFLLRDAWNLQFHGAFDLITSNGLTMYEPDDARVEAFYRECYEALKSGGCFVTSFITPPPAQGNGCSWKMDAINKDDALLQKIIFADILDCRWQTYRSEEKTRNLLKSTGFTEVEMIYDTARMFPTVIATK